MVAKGTEISRPVYLGFSTELLVGIPDFACLLKSLFGKLCIYPVCQTTHSTKLIRGLLDNSLSQVDTCDSDLIPFSQRGSSPCWERLRLKPLLTLLKQKLPSKAVLASWLQSFLAGTFFRSLSSLASFEDYTCITFHGPNPKTTHIFCNYILDCDPEEMGGNALPRAGKEMERESRQTSRTEVGRKVRYHGKIASGQGLSEIYPEVSQDSSKDKVLLASSKTLNVAREKAYLAERMRHLLQVD